MSKQSTTKRLHIVLVPFPAQGHLIPTMQLANLLHSKGFYITFVNTEFNHRRLIRSKGTEWIKGFENFHFEAIPEGLPPSDRNATQDPVALCDSIRKNCLSPFRDLLSKFASHTGIPPVSCIISDGFMSFAIKAAEELDIPVVQFWTASACGFMGYLQFNELMDRGIIPFKDLSFMNDGSLDTPIDWVPGMKNIRLKDFPSFVRTTDPNDTLLNYLGDEAQNCLKATAMIINTFTSLEHEVLQAIASKFPRIYAVGPLSKLSKTIAIKDSQVSSFRPNLWKEETECLEWLDKQEPKTVIYINYGSVTIMSDLHLIEFAWGLANSKHPFLWIVRPDIVMGDSGILPKEFLEETKDRGLLAGWCRQDQVLDHPSIGVFLTHCGWNSILESISSGVPLISWPFFAEQQTNCWYSCAKWGIGMELSHDVKRNEVEELVKNAMEGEKGKLMKQNALEWKKKVEVATTVGGSSHLDFDRFVKEVIGHTHDMGDK
ncbi:hypothetical protein ACH5RR_012296 [Cinchona calisaya]|uniref:Glycosyltransferase n=1 Tax=Cinchona calisaya TaxID=153742 RepID=A0ABD3AAZ7_9GENT